MTISCANIAQGLSKLVLYIDIQLCVHISSEIDVEGEESNAYCRSSEAE